MTTCVLRKMAALLLDIIAQVRSKAVGGEECGVVLFDHSGGFAGVG